LAWDGVPRQGESRALMEAVPGVANAAGLAAILDKNPFA
jgi:hypothetical protein